MTKTFLDDLWTHALAKIVSALRTHTVSINRTNNVGVKREQKNEPNLAFCEKCMKRHSPVRGPLTVGS